MTSEEPTLLRAHAVRRLTDAPGGKPRPARRRGLLATPPQPPRRVLVVDDNADGADSTAMMLRAWGFETRCVYDGESVESAAATFAPHVVLLDIGLPRMSGCEVARRLRDRAQFDATVLIALTGYGRDEDRQRTFDAGCDHHLTKPVDPDVLRTMVTTAARVARRAAEFRDRETSGAAQLGEDVSPGTTL